MSSERFSLAARLRARPAGREKDYCVFARSGRDFAVSVSAAHEMVAGKAVTQVPRAPAALIGVVNLRGEVLPLVQLDSLLGMPLQPYSAGYQILVVSSDDVDVGLLVDRVCDVRSIDPKEITPCPAGEPGHRLCRGDWRGPTGVVAVLDAEKLVAEAINTISVSLQRLLSCRGGDDPGPLGAVPFGNSRRATDDSYRCALHSSLPHRAAPNSLATTAGFRPSRGRGGPGGERDRVPRGLGFAARAGSAVPGVDP